ncbi:MAG TPA: 3-ketoacyl-ACP reductase [Lacipirellulaceae bacterium]|jgi:NAD(P)-dependent dehydrogenase (short-subunit alcohol dehydrogenase family)|nr:3-ketoacyl-ACP reductase [Lacipirellulaceae bacterium]
MADKARVALVTGGSRGIGFGIARALASEGWQLALNGMRAEDDIREVLGKLRDEGTDVFYCRGDVGSSQDRERIIAETIEHFGGIQLLLNNAGITSPGRADILDATEESFDAVIDINLKGALFLSQLAARQMMRQREADAAATGCIVNISSISAHTSSLNRGDYCISRACMSQLTRLLAARLIEYGINVYEVRPGIIRTDMTRAVTEKYDRLIADGLTLEPRWGTPDDIGGAVAILARGELCYAPGTVLAVDGGISLLQDLGIS